ncbi:MAG: EAL domain-containing protein [Dermatophilaceae bacterium]
MEKLVWTRPRRAGELIEATRWLFAVLTLVSLPVALVGPLTASHGAKPPLALASALVLGLSWTRGYLSRRAPLGMDLVDAVATLTFALASPEPGAALAFMFPALWFRSLYGSTGRAVLRFGIYVGALSASFPLWNYVPWHTGGTGFGPLTVALPTLLLTVLVSRHFAGSVQAREQSARRDAVHALLGSQLLGVIDAAEIRQIFWGAIAGICAATPGLRVLKVIREGEALRVDGATGGFAGVPATLPITVLSVRRRDGEAGSEMADSPAELDAAAGIPCAWACVPLPHVHNQQGGGWLLLGSPLKVPVEGVVAVASLANQVTLALRNLEVHQALTEQATLDSLTGLANRAAFNTALSAALEDESLPDTTVLFVDLDDFKDVNDVFGHGAGDDLLREVAARLRRATRPQDLCARLGGDEFAVLLPGTGGAAAADIAQQIVQAVAATAHIDAGVAHVGASVGVATSTGNTDLEQLIHRADVAMYAAKANGKSRIQVFEPGLLQGDSAQVTFERQLAAAASNGELIVYYQPVLSLPDEECTAVEALVRWRHPELGLLLPDSFIEAAERIGAIRDIGTYVLRRACSDAATWREAYPGSQLAIHVNVSALQLDDDLFVDAVTQALSEFAMPPEQLVLEITESVVISSAVVIERLNTLAAQGITIAIDDFGTGYSALTTLRTLPAKIVKIDKSFVDGSTENAEDRAVIEAVVKMAAQMGMQTIAEGVERLKQQTFLETIGADSVQGYLYLRPTTAEKFGVWFAAHLAGLARNRPGQDVVIAFTPRHTA